MARSMLKKALRIAAFTMGITNQCYGRCRVCCARSTPEATAMMPTTAFEHYARQARGLEAKELLLSGGDPLLHPQIHDLVDIAHNLGFRYVRILSGGWSSEESPQKVRVLTSLLSEFKDRLSLNLTLTFSPFRDNGDLGKVRTSWLTTIRDFLVLAPLLKSGACSENLLAWKLGLGVDHTLAVSLFSELVEYHGGSFSPTVRSSLLGGDTVRLVSFPRLRAYVLLSTFAFQKFGAAESQPIELEDIPGCDFADEITGVSLEWPSNPYLTVDGFLHPCCSAANINTSRRAAINISPESGVSLSDALRRYSGMAREIVRSRAEIYGELRKGSPFCRACVAARVKLLLGPTS